MPTYNGGLGVLAGDTIRSAVDLKVPIIPVKYHVTSMKIISSKRFTQFFRQSRAFL
jgi:hypothetical protein